MTQWLCFVTEEVAVQRRLLMLSILLVGSCGCATLGRQSSVPAVDPHPPTNLTEALDRLERTLPAETLEKMRAGTEEEMVQFHFNVGLMLRNSWGLRSRGPLYRYLAGLGLQHPDDMSGLILKGLWRRLHGQPLQVEEEVARCQEYWRVHQDPDPRSNPACLEPITTTLRVGPDADDVPVRGVHMGRCCRDGRVWSYHVDRGWYRPTEAEMVLWKQQQGGQDDPCQK
jgi:hypothetical protein